jgi:5-methylcytosine-specific restriction endonuclease McrA
MTVATVQVGVLNATYQPLGPTKLDRAIALILRGKAVVEEADPARTLRHKDGKMPWPLVIRLLQYVKVPVRYGEQIWSKAGVLKRDGHRCAYCGKHGDTIDHILPRSRGGRDEWLNTVACCSPCNLKKSNRYLEDTGMVLLVTPTAPTRVFISAKRK